MSKDKAQEAVAATAVAGYVKPTFTVKSHVTVPLLKLDLNVTRYVTILTPIAEGAKVEKGSNADMEAAKLCRVTDLENGNENEIIIPAVLLSILNEKYPETAYVGKHFAITKVSAPSDGKRYSRFSLDEISID